MECTTIVEAQMPVETILKLVGIEIDRCECQPGKQSHAAGNFRLHNIPTVCPFFSPRCVT